MKRILLVYLLLIFCNFGFSQNINLAGKWTGKISDNTMLATRTIDFNVQFNQSGTAVWGIYTKGDHPTLDSCDCAGKLTSRISIKDSSIVLIFQDGVIEHKAMPLDSCNLLNYLKANYVTEDGKEYLTGRWYAKHLNYLDFDGGASGSFFLERNSLTADKKIDQYFPRLEQLIEKFNSQ